MKIDKNIIKELSDCLDEFKLTEIEIAEKDIQLAKGGLQPNLTAFYGFNSRVSYADRFTGNGIFNDVPIGFVPSTNETVLRSVEGSKTVGPLSFEDQFNFKVAEGFPPTTSRNCKSFNPDPPPKNCYCYPLRENCTCD